MKVTLSYVNILPGAPTQSQMEVESTTMGHLLAKVNENRFVEFKVRVALDDSTFERRKVIVNRNNIVGIIEGWFDE